MIDGSTIFKGKYWEYLQFTTFDPVHGFWTVIYAFGVVFGGQSNGEVRIDIYSIFLKFRICHLFNYK